ncbi:phosphotransferase [Arenibacterium sp. LLYu02]|uniref:phosphotransferase n=1 Tax=Arenibacterium sp. LLYu02 TaxID=3404132 RepID=UPI003B217C68
MTHPSPLPQVLGLLRDQGLVGAQTPWRLLKSVETPGEERKVYLLSPLQGPALIVKHMPALAEATFATLDQTYRTLAAALPAEGGNRMAPLVHVDAAARVMVFTHESGLTAHARLEAAEISLDSRAEVIRAMGAWLRQLHDGGGVEAPREVSFDGGDILRRTRRLAREVRAGQRAVAQPKRFLGLCAFVHQVLEAAQGARCIEGLRHGDPHGRNFIFAKDALVAIDPIPRGVGPVAWDIARLTTRLVYSLGPTAEAGSTEGLARLAPQDWEALATGYGQDWRSDPVLKAFLCRQALADWSLLPAERSARSAAQQRRLERVVGLVAQLRGQGPQA